MEPKIEEILARGVSEVIDRGHLKKKLLSGKKLRVKLGIDPTSPYLHLGRAVTLLKLKDLQDLGHQIVFIIGDFTGVIGDTSDKESERPMLDEKTIRENLKTYKEQAGKILDIKKVELRHNSEWLSALTYKEIARQANMFSVAEFIARENIKKRMDEGKRVSLREVLYPLMQGYDSVLVKADLELGGTDQRFNLLAGREMQKNYSQEPQDILMNNLIEGTDGRKMSSSWGNTINISDEPDGMFGKIMSLNDELIIKYFIHCTRVPLDEIQRIEKGIKSGKLNPRDAKLRLALEIVSLYHGENKAREAQNYFIAAFSKKEIPEKIKETIVKGDKIKIAGFLVLSGNAESKSDARRKIEQGGVEMDGKKIEDWQKILNSKDDGKVFKIGKYGFAKIKFQKKS